MLKKTDKRAKSIHYNNHSYVLMTDLGLISLLGSNDQFYVYAKIPIVIVPQKMLQHMLGDDLIL